MCIIKPLTAIYHFMARHPNIFVGCIILFFYFLTWLCKDRIFASVTQPGQPPRPFFQDDDSIIDDHYSGNIDEALRKYEQEDFVLFFLYAPWDVECQKSRPTLLRVAIQLKDQVPVVAVNCWMGADACRSQGFHLYRYPQLVARIRRQSMPHTVLSYYQEEHLQLIYRGPLHASHSLHRRINPRAKQTENHTLASDHVIAFVHRLLFPYHALHAPMGEDDKGDVRITDNSQLTQLASEYDNVVVGFFDPLYIPKSRKFLLFYESSLLSLDKGVYRPSGAPFHLAFALITSSHHSHFYAPPKILPVFSLNSSKLDSDLPHSAFRFTGKFPHGTLLLLRAGNQPLLIQHYQSSSDLLQFLERNTEKPLVHRVFMNGVKSLELESILASGPSLLLLMAEDPRCRLKPLQKLLRRLSISDRFSRSNSAELSSTVEQNTAFAEWFKTYEYVQRLHRSSNLQWNELCRRWYGWIKKQTRHKVSLKDKAHMTSSHSCSNLSYHPLCGSTVHSNHQRCWTSHSFGSKCTKEEEISYIKQPAHNIFTYGTSESSYPWEESVEQWGQAQLSVSCDDPEEGKSFLYNDLPLDEELLLSQHSLVLERAPYFNRTMQFIIVDGPGSDVLRSRLGFPFTDNSSLRDVISLLVDLKQENVFLLDKPVSYFTLKRFVNDYKKDAFHTNVKHHSFWHVLFEHEKQTLAYKAALRSSLRNSILMCHSDNFPQLITGLQLNQWINEAASVNWRKQCRESFSSTMPPTTFSCCHLLVFYYSPNCGFCSILWPRVITAWRHVNNLLHSTLPKDLRKVNGSQDEKPSMQKNNHYHPVKNVTLVKLDLTANTLPWRLRVERVPTLILFPAWSASQSVAFPISYSLTVPNMVEFVLTNIKIPYSSM